MPAVPLSRWSQQIGGVKTFGRVFAMPSHDTLAVTPMRDFARKHLMKGGRSVDPFARNCRLATVTNDLNPETAADYHMDAVDFCEMLAGQGELFDVAIFDPPYSPRQISECYQQVGRECSTADTQSSFWRKCRDALDSIVRPGGVVLSYGWNTNGMGKGRGYAIEDILIVAHGGAHNDTICMAERKLLPADDLFTVPRIPARKPGGVPPTSATGQLSTPDDDFASSPFVGATCGGVGPRDCPAAVLSCSSHSGDMRHGE